jgi:ubiquinone biosynthesis protein COQ9
MADPSPLEQLRRRLALAVGENAVFDGWTRQAVDSAAQQLGVDPVQARLAMPKSQSAMIDLYIQEVDRGLEAYSTPERLSQLKIRDKIRALVWRRLEIMAPAREAVRRALAILAMPQNLPLALRISWRTADRMWRIAGDTSTDFNHYTKRMTLGAVYGSTLLVWLDDQSEGWTTTAGFLDRRIDDVM